MEPHVQESAGPPPIVLLVENDFDTLDMYSTYFEMSGMWVARSASPAEAMAGIADLNPDVVVTGLDFDSAPGDELVHALKANPGTERVPVVVLSGYAGDRVPEAVRADADLCLLKPVLPDELMWTVQSLLQKSRALRARSDRARERTTELVQRSNSAISRANAISQEADTAPARRCPRCGHALVWTERGSIGNVSFDYYRWCGRGCGLYCFDRDGQKWVKLA